MRPIVFARGDSRYGLADLEMPLPLEELAPDGDGWEVEIGFGKGRYLLSRAAAEPSRRFLGIEIASKYFRLAQTRGERRGLRNLVLILGEALYVISSALPRGFADVVHVYFPDPWPKERHQKRRLFDADTVDVVLSMLKPGGRLNFATDFLEYGQQVEELLRSHPRLEVETISAWPEGPRTNYESKYELEGRPILRLVARLADGDDLVHPLGRVGVLVATPGESDE